MQPGEQGREVAVPIAAAVLLVAAAAHLGSTMPTSSIGRAWLAAHEVSSLTVQDRRREVHTPPLRPPTPPAHAEVEQTTLDSSARGISPIAMFGMPVHDAAIDNSIYRHACNGMARSHRAASTEADRSIRLAWHIESSLLHKATVRRSE